MGSMQEILTEKYHEIMGDIGDTSLAAWLIFGAVIAICSVAVLRVASSR